MMTTATTGATKIASPRLRAGRAPKREPLSLSALATATSAMFGGLTAWPERTPPEGPPGE